MGVAGRSFLSFFSESRAWVLCLLIPLLSVGGLSSSAAGGLGLSSSIAVDSVSVEDYIHEERGT